MFLGKSMRMAVMSGAGLTMCGAAHADFFTDSKADVELRNVYFNRDFRQSGARDQADEWAQGFIFHVQSGYTPGVVGFGVDALGMLGYKLRAPACCRPIPTREVPRVPTASWA
jgi:hypothetical protein